MCRSRDFLAKYTNRVRKPYDHDRLEQYHRTPADLFDYAEIEREFAQFTTLFSVSSDSLSKLQKPDPRERVWLGIRPRRYRYGDTVEQDEQPRSNFMILFALPSFAARGMLDATRFFKVYYVFILDYD